MELKHLVDHRANAIAIISYSPKTASVKPCFLRLPYLDVDINDMDGLVADGALILEVLQRLIVDSLLSRENYIIRFVCYLKPLRPLLNPPVTVEHVEDAVLGVQGPVLLGQVVENLLIGCSEIVNIGSVGSWTRQLHLDDQNMTT